MLLFVLLSFWKFNFQKVRDELDWLLVVNDCSFALFVGCLGFLNLCEKLALCFLALYVAVRIPSSTRVVLLDEYLSFYEPWRYSSCLQYLIYFEDTPVFHYLTYRYGVASQAHQKLTPGCTKPKRKSLLQARDCMGKLPKSCSPKPYSHLYFMHIKPHLYCHIKVIKKLNYRRHKARLVPLRTFLELWTKSLMDWVSVPIWVDVGAYVLGFKVRF